MQGLRRAENILALLLEDLTGRIIGAYYRVYNELGHGP
jgi:hypothetical protein